MNALPTKTPARSNSYLTIVPQYASSSTEEIGYSVHERLQPLAEALAGAVRFRDACRLLQEKAARRDPNAGVPELFSFDQNWQTRLDAFRPKPTSYLTSHGSKVRRQSPLDAQAWESLTPFIEVLLPTLLGSVEARRVARAVQGLTESAAALAADHEAAGRLHELLNVADDMAFTVRHPATQREWRVFASGIENNHQLQVLLVDALMRDDDSERFDPRVTAAYRGLPVTDESLTATVRFGMYSVRALRTDGTLPHGLSGSDHWIWGEHSPRTIPVQHGERIIYLGDPPYMMEWDVERRFSTMRSEVEVVEAVAMLPMAA